MCDTETQVAMVIRRGNVLRRRRENRLLAALSALCLMLTAGLAGVIGTFGGRVRGTVQGLFGSAMLLDDAGGYVLVGVISFAAAVAITVMCIRHREKREKTSGKTEEDQT